jgi:tRNA 2-thiouridine synthesizing protein B
MTTLHVLSHSPFTDSRLSSCLRILGPEDAVLLCGDAVHGLQPGSAAWAELEHSVVLPRLFVLDEDILARAISADARVQRVDYPGFVQLSLEYDKVNTWL